MAIACGINFAELLIKAAKGYDLGVIDYPKNVKFHWPFSEEIQLAIKSPTLLPSILIDFLDPRTKSNVEFTDIMPHFYELIYSIYRLFRNYLKVFREIFTFGFQRGFVKYFSEISGIPC